MTKRAGNLFKTFKSKDNLVSSHRNGKRGKMKRPDVRMVDENLD